MLDTPITAPVQFVTSKKSEAFKTRYWMWGGLVLSMVVVTIVTGAHPVVLCTAAFMLALLGLIDWFAYRRIGAPGQVLLTLDDTSIHSLKFSTKEKAFRWNEITGMSLEVVQNQRYLRLQLAPHPDRPDKRAFLTGLNPSRPLFPLTLLAPEDHERLFDEVARRLQQKGIDSESTLGKVNEVTEERLFREKLVAMAPRTWITYSLIAVNIAIWLAFIAAGGGFAKSSPELLFLWGANSTSAVQQGEWWRLLTSAFLHGSVVHIAFNMFALASIGPNVERMYGHRLFALIYFGSALLGNAASLYFSAQSNISVGASGAIFGVAGALLIGTFKHRKSLPKIFGKQTLSGMGMFVVYSLVQGLSASGIDNAAHVGGFIAGTVIAFVLPTRFDMARYKDTAKGRSACAAVLIFAAVGTMIASAPEARVDIGRAFNSQKTFATAMTDFDRAVKLIAKDAEDTKSGKLTLLEADDRSRTVHAPLFKNIVTQLEQVHFPAEDPVSALAGDFRRMSVLMLETLAMQSIVVDGKPVPVDTERSKIIEAEVLKLNTRITAQIEQLKSQRKK